MAGFGKGLFGGLLTGVSGLGILALVVEPAYEDIDSARKPLVQAAERAETVLDAVENDALPDMQPEELLDLVAGPDLKRVIVLASSQYQPQPDVISPARPELGDEKGRSAAINDTYTALVLAPYLPTLPFIEAAPGITELTDEGLNGAVDSALVPLTPPDDIGKPDQNPAQAPSETSNQPSPTPDSGRRRRPTQVEMAPPLAGAITAPGDTLLTGPRRSERETVKDTPVSEELNPENSPVNTAPTHPPGQEVANRLAQLILPSALLVDPAVFSVSDNPLIAPLSSMETPSDTMLSEAPGNRRYPSPDLSIPPHYLALFPDESLP